MFYTYVLSDSNGNFYVGYSENLKVRLRQHKDGEVFSTRGKLPVSLVYYEAGLDKYDALKRAGGPLEEVDRVF